MTRRPGSQFTVSLLRPFRYNKIKQMPNSDHILLEISQYLFYLIFKKQLMSHTIRQKRHVESNLGKMRKEHIFGGLRTN